MNTAEAHGSRVSWVEQIMGLPVSVHVRGDDPERAEDRVAALFADLRRVDAVLSPYANASDLNRWDRGEIDLAEADPMLAEVVAMCDQARDRTHGWFDPRGLPDPITGVPRYDPSGLVKGWAVERASLRLAGLGYPAGLDDMHDLSWCVNAGGDVVVHAPDGQPPWRIGVEDPVRPSTILRVVTRSGGAVATSGSAHRGAHIVDPHTRRPATAVRAVTVTGPSLTWADVYATAAVARGPSALAWLAGIDGYEALMVSAGGVLRATSGWPTVSPPG